MAREWLDFWSLISARRMEQRQRPLTSPFMDMGILDPALPTFWAIVERNLGRARRRYLRACGHWRINGGGREHFARTVG